MKSDCEREVLIACNTLRTEIEYLSGKHGLERRTVWLESKLHNVPSNLSGALQEALDEVEDADRVILGFANCGNVVQGLHVGDFELVVPRLDDCISLVLGSQFRREAYGSKWRSMFYTDGWMDKGHNIFDDYDEYIERFGEEEAEDVFKMLYEHYRTMTYIDTGLYDVAALMENMKPMAEMLELEQRVEPGTLDYVERLLLGPWDEELFVVVGPNEVVPSAPFMQPGSVL